MLLPFLTLLSLLFHYSLQYSYFCDLPCKSGGEHTVCKYEPCNPNDGCGSQYKMLQLNDEERTFITEVHNKLRQTVASGQDTQGGNGESSNMRALFYSKELEFVAQCWANQCSMEGSHDTCRSIKRYDYVGQNVYWRSMSTEETTNEHLEKAVTAWYSEISKTTAAIIDKYPKGGKGFGHFTQVVWAKSVMVGCGRTRYGENGDMTLLIVCNYAPAGNFIGKCVYERGGKCSSCGGNIKCNEKYNALCGTIRAVENDDWEAPFALGAPPVGIASTVLLIFTSVGTLCFI